MRTERPKSFTPHFRVRHGSGWKLPLMLSGSRECCENTITNSGVVGRKELEDLRLDPWATRRRRNLPELLDQLDPWIEQLDQAVAQEAERCREAVYLMKQPGVLMGNTKR